MKRTVMKSTRVDNNPPMCEICKHSRGCRVDPPMCDYDIVDRDELRNRIFYAVTENTRGEDITYPDDVIKEMNRRFLEIYQGHSYEIYNMNFDHMVCPECNGSGVIIDASGIRPCGECDGIGIKEIPVKKGFFRAYMIFEIPDHEFTDMTIYGIFKTQEEADDVYNDDINLMGNRNIKVDKIFLSNTMDEPSMWQMLNNLVPKGIFKPVLPSITVYDTKTQSIFVSGISWDEFWNDERYAGSLISTNQAYHDLSAMTDGRYIMMTSRAFNEKYQVLRNDFVDTLYEAMFVNLVDGYISFVTYGENDGYHLLSCYINKYFNMAMIRENLLSYIRKYSEDITNTIILGDEAHLLDKITVEFNSVGIKINKSEAVAVAQLSSQCCQDANARLRQYNSVAVYLMEYVVISPEYAIITEESE